MIGSIILNFDELIELLKENDLTLTPPEIDYKTALEGLRDLIDLLIENVPAVGTQFIDGFGQYVPGYTSLQFIFTKPENISLTAFAFSSQRFYHGDYFNLFVVSPDLVEVVLFKQIFFKDLLQRKTFAALVPIPKNYKMIVEIFNTSPEANQYFYDFEYLGKSSLIKPPIIPDNDFEIEHPYDYIITVVWGYDGLITRSVDFDSELTYEGDTAARVNYMNRNYKKDDENQFWLDKDVRSQTAEVTPEIMTILGLKGWFSLTVNNFFGYTIDGGKVKITAKTSKNIILSEFEVDARIFSETKDRINVMRFNSATGEVLKEVHE